MNIQDPKFLAQVEQAVREAGQIFYDRTKVSHMKHKGVTDFVTEVDLSVQTFLKERLAQLAPEVQLMGEEKDNSGLDFEKPMWILDPVDGTMNLVHGFRHSAVSLALADRGPAGLRSLCKRGAHPCQRSEAAGRLPGGRGHQPQRAGDGRPDLPVAAGGV